jgi:hypothetical protein
LATQTRTPGDASKPDQAFSYTLSSPISSARTEGRSTQGGDVDLVRIACLDGLGRTVQGRIQLDGGVFQADGYRVLNRKGQAVRAFQPYASQTDACETSASRVPQGTAFVAARFDAHTPSMDTSDLPGCIETQARAVASFAPDVVVGRAAVPGDVTARLAGGLARREEPVALAPGEPVSAPTETRLRWALEGAVRDGTARQAFNAALRFEGATLRRIDFGTATAVRAPTAAERGASDFVGGALAFAVIETLDEGPRHVSVTRQGDVVRIHTANPDAAPGARPVIITQRVGLPPRGALTVVPP